LVGAHAREGPDRRAVGVEGEDARRGDEEEAARARHRPRLRAGEVEGDRRAPDRDAGAGAPAGVAAGGIARVAGGEVDAEGEEGGGRTRGAEELAAGRAHGLAGRWRDEGDSPLPARRSPAMTTRGSPAQRATPQRTTRSEKATWRPGSARGTTDAPSAPGARLQSYTFRRSVTFATSTRASTTAPARVRVSVRSRSSACSAGSTWSSGRSRSNGARAPAPPTRAT